MDQVKDLQVAIERLYAVFSYYPLNPNMQGCEHCVSLEEQKVLHTKALLDLTEQDLSSYMSSALFTFGNLDDFKHFLPRLLEQMALDPEWFQDVDPLERIRRQGDWSSWPIVEQRVIRQFVNAWWQFRLVSFPGLAKLPYIQTGDRLIGVAQIEDDLMPLLEAWLRDCDNQTVPLYHLAEFIDWPVASLLDGGKISDFWADNLWERRKLQMDQVIGWLRDDRTFEVLMRSYEERVSRPVVSDLELAIERYREPLVNMLLTAVDMLSLIRNKPDYSI